MEKNISILEKENRVILHASLALTQRKSFSRFLGSFEPILGPKIGSKSQKLTENFIRIGSSYPNKESTTEKI